MNYATNTSPCLSCTRVKDPKNCENKQCNSWRQWFLRRWEQLRLQFGQHAAPSRPADPCGVCTVPRQLCDSPCRRKRAWQALQKELIP